jgi:enamine deaminase RidA (YjgF/YER057c/UK114 family)
VAPCPTPAGEPNLVAHAAAVLRRHPTGEQLVQVAALAVPGLLVEVEAIAGIPRGRA